MTKAPTRRLIDPTGNHSPAGTFIKTLSPHVVEVLGTTDLDFGVIDAEHAPFDRATLDIMMIAGRAAGLPLITRIPDHAAATILSALDMGAAGLLVPHVDSPEQARQIVRAAKYKIGTRGYSSGPRSAGYGSLSMDETIRRGDDARIIAQIESPEAVAEADAILSIDGIDGVFVGRADLALSFGLSSAKHERVLHATYQVLEAARSRNKIAGIAAGDREECEAFKVAGANWFVIASDQSLLRRAVQQVCKS